MRPANLNNINYLNIFLMLFSLVCSYLKPFETFLIVYSVLGPLHYLTEISWLHDRNYFTGKKKDALILVVLCALVTLAVLGIISVPFNFTTILIFYAFCVSSVFLLTKATGPRLIVLAMLIPVSVYLASFDWINSVFNIFLPTIIHVFVFTGLFILIGALRSKSWSGYLSLIVFIFCACFFLFGSSYALVSPVGEHVKSNYEQFKILNYYLMYPFSEHALNRPANFVQYIDFVNNVLYTNPSAFAIMGFISFAYFYHYLNWFSKTEVIRWHQISKQRFCSIILIYLLSITIYLYDYKLGLALLFFLSLLHVFLEFPLNHKTFASLFEEIGKKLTNPKASGS